MSSLHRVTFLLLPLFFFFRGFSQEKEILINHPDRYRLDLPKVWNRHKVIEAITDILPVTIEELRDRDFCTFGKAGFYVKLAIDSLVVTNEQTSQPIEIGSIPHYTFSFIYSFHAALVVFDSLGRSITMLQLISSDESMDYARQFTLRPQNITYKYQTVYDTRGRAVGRRLVEDARAFNNYVPRLSAGSVLTEDFLLTICEKKIYEIRRLLRRLAAG